MPLTLEILNHLITLSILTAQFGHKCAISYQSLKKCCKTENSKICLKTYFLPSHLPRVSHLENVPERPSLTSPAELLNQMKRKNLHYTNYNKTLSCFA